MLRTLAILLLGAASARRISPEAQQEETGFLNALVEEIRGRSQHVLVLDVGANDGQFSEGLMRTLHRRTGQPVELVMVEPQPRFAAKLGRIARRWNGTHLAVAAWTERKQLVFREDPSNSKKSSLLQRSGAVGTAGGAGAAAGGGGRVVQAIDFPAYLREALRRADMAFVKLDVEGAEYDVLPPLLLGGLLCAPVRFLTLEWHLNYLAAPRRLGGVALRHSLDTLLRAGCPAGRPPPRVTHEEFRGVNFGKAVPGLLEEAARHASGCRAARVGGPRAAGQLVHGGRHAISERCVINGSVPGVGLDYELTVRKEAARHQLTLINGVR